MTQRSADHELGFIPARERMAPSAEFELPPLPTEVPQVLLMGKPLPWERAVTIFKEVAPNPRLARWRDMAQRAIDNDQFDEARRFVKYVIEQESDIAREVCVWALRLKRLLPELPDEVLRLVEEA